MPPLGEGDIQLESLIKTVLSASFVTQIGFKSLDIPTLLLQGTRISLMFTEMKEIPPLQAAQKCKC